MRGKKDRLARLLKVLYILCQNPDGLELQEIAKQCGVSVRTIRRDIAALESELNIPISGERGKRGIGEGYFLPPVHFSPTEAMTIFLASRLLLSYSNVYNPGIASTLMKLNSIVPTPLKDQIWKTIQWMQKQKKDEHFRLTMETLAHAWMNKRRVRIWYWTLGDKSPKRRVIEPYFIQPAALEHANYVIAYCHQARSVRTFKVERIKSIELLGEQYTVPEDFDANEYLGSAWGISVYGEVECIRLRFNPEIARIAEEIIWHPSQVTESQPDGSTVVTMRLPITVELEAFILGWGEKVEVLEPEELRERVARTARAILEVYKRK